ncbi:hypothetical protein ACFY12_34280 [Streptomyces sp. NPDC001339]|uniref:hypothetical protein n=1 Tax=Streptomyces sp. NPDC001339 TaxID=3364563 RepID=UPI0036BF3B15
MQINGAEQQQRGHVLLIAGDVAASRRSVQVEPGANLAALSIVPVPALLGSDAPTDTTYLDGARDQNALLMRLRAAAATPGPLLIYLSGRLTVDRRGRQLYLALPGTTTATTRYTALPWEWLGTELRHRPAGLTTVMFDVAADKGAWELVQEYGTLPASPSVDAYGVIAPPGFPGDGGVSPYTRAWIDQLRRNPDRPANSRLHAFTIAAAPLPPGAVVLPSTPEIERPAEPRRPMTNVQRLLAGDTSFLPRRRQPEPPAPAPQADEQWDEDQALAHYLPSATHQRVEETHHPARSAYHPQPPPGPVPQQTAPQARPQPQPQPQPQAPYAAPAQHVPAQAPPVQQAAPAPAAPAPVRQQPVPVQQQPVVAQQEQDPRPYIAAAAQAGNHREAAQMAVAWEQYALQKYGISSPQATQWTEIRADLAKMSGNNLLATQLWIAAARTRLAHQSPDAVEVLDAARSAHYCWEQITDPAEGRSTGPELINLLRQLPSLDPRQLLAAQQRMDFLNNAPNRR